jgi:hypothetical protein
MSEFKKISIDPAHFQYSASKDTRKRRPKTSEGGSGEGSNPANPIKVRGPPKPRDDHNKTTKRNALLKFIRRHQSDNYQRLLEQGGGNANGEPSNAPPRSTTKSEIDDTLDYLMNVADEVRQKEIVRGQGHGQVSGPGNHTLKRHIPVHEYVSTEFPTVASMSTSMTSIRPQPSDIRLNPRPLPPPPQYGILKGGNMPTYREWRQKPVYGSGPGPLPSSLPGANNISGGSGLIPSSIMPSVPISPIQSTYQPNSSGLRPSEFPGWRHSAPLPNPNPISNSSLWSEGSNMNPEDYILGKGGAVTRSPESTIHGGKVRLKIMRQRRTSRRTYKVGKSKTHPKVGVLISNRTLRKTISTQALHLKQTPIAEVKRYLVKHGLIRVGTASPDYMLRKLYESAQMVPGEIHNHNVDNLLYNFMNTRDEK